MRLRRITLRGLGPWKQEATLDLGPLDGLVALVGSNGQGKTILLESWLAALYRKLPTYSAIEHLIPAGGDGMIECEWSHGQEYRSTVHVSRRGDRTKGEAYLYGSDGRTVEGCEDGKLPNYDEAVVARAPSYAAMLATCFSAQWGVGSLVRLTKKGDRRELFADLLDLDRMEHHAQRCRTERTARGAAAEAHEAMLARTVGTDTKALKGDLAVQRGLLEAALSSLEQGQREAKTATAELARTHGLYAQFLTEERWKQEARSSLDTLDQEIERRKSERMQADAILRDEEAIRRDHTVLITLRSRLPDQEKEWSALEDERRRAIASHDKWHSDRDVKRQARRTFHLEAIRAREWLSKAQARIDEIQARIGDLECQTGEAPCSGVIPDNDLAGCRYYQQARGEIDRLQQELRAAQEEANGAAASWNKAEAEGLKVEAVLEETRPERDVLEALVGTATKVTREAEDAVVTSRTRVSTLTNARTEERFALLERVRNGSDIDQALEQLTTRREDLERRIAAAAEHPFDAKQLRLAERQEQAARSKEQAAQAEVARIRERIVGIEGQITNAAMSERLRAEATAAIAVEKQAWQDWDALARALGPTGLQALEIDAAGPAISQGATDLLREAYGSRWVVRLSTQVLRADGDGMKEDNDFIVTDLERGREGPLRRFSGGELTILSEAIGLAMGLHHGQVSGIVHETLVRDECSGALDRDHAMKYAQMLRRALRISQARTMLFVAHDPQLWDMADHVVRVQDGRIEVER